MHASRVLRSIIAVASVGAALVASPAWSVTPGARAAPNPAVHTHAYRSTDSGPAVHHDTSPPLRELSQRTGRRPSVPSVMPPAKAPQPFRAKAASADQAVQDRDGSRGRIPLGVGFEGIRQGGGVPPDPNASVGSRQIVEITNFDLAVYSKTGATLLGPLTTQTLFSGFGGPCETAQNADIGDPVVRWDSLAQRWILNQFALDQAGNTNRLCVAVSRTADATGEYYRYDFGYHHFIDHPKVSVWPDAYYAALTAGAFFETCAWDRHRMLRGADADQQCYTLASPTIPLTSDLDGTAPPPQGEPNLLIALNPAHDSLQYWRFHVDWADQTRTAVAGPGELQVAPYTPACASTDPTQCVPQAGTAQKLDSLSYSAMYRLAYRNFGDHQSLVVNHAVDAPGGRVGVRWYELRLDDGRPVVHQQSTYAPGPGNRWMGSAAQNGDGDIALGYSSSSSRTHPSIRVTGRLANDPQNVMTFRETTVWTGTGSQTGSNRWGDYTSMAIDPVDDCTFWYTNQYQPTDGTGNWNTR
ncbi:hypothetical protein LN042_29330, partial [Kitasatospora sp. RB6PN24]|uniref:hypothetical protein n=1 Tax=Kitasatospora humi TaxID=2893891 RepID=UPI001E32D0E3